MQDVVTYQMSEFARSFEEGLPFFECQHKTALYGKDKEEM